VTVQRNGFTLIEVMVALAILGLSLVTIIQLFGQGLRLLRVAGEHQRAVVLADRKVREMPDTPLEEGVVTGEEEGYRWERRVTALPPPEEEKDTSQPTRVRTFQITLEIRWGQGKTTGLTTLRSLRTREP